MYEFKYPNILITNYVASELCGPENSAIQALAINGNAGAMPGALVGMGSANERRRC